MMAILSRMWLAAVAYVALLFGRTRRALDVYQQMVKINPRDHDARATIGNLRMQLGDVDGAIAEFRQLLDFDVDNADAWFNLGYLLETRNELAEAERAFGRAAHLNPSHDRAWYGLGLVLIRTDRLREAIDVLKKNTRLQPFSPYGWYQLGMTYHHLGESGEAWRTYEHLKSFEPRYAATLKHDMESTPPRSLQFSTTPQANPKEAISSTT